MGNYNNAFSSILTVFYRTPFLKSTNMNSRFSLLIILSISFLLASCNLTSDLKEIETNRIQFDGVWQSESSNLASNVRGKLQKRTLQIYQDFSYSLVDADHENNVSVAKGSFDFEEGIPLKGISPITIHQTYPLPVTYEGIVEINVDVEPMEMTIEYVQVFPSQEMALAPPIVDEGFGSTDDFNLGIGNVQKFSLQ